MKKLMTMMFAMPAVLLSACAAENDQSVQQDGAGGASAGVAQEAIGNCGPSGCTPLPPAAPTVTMKMGTATASSVALSWSDTFTNERGQQLWRRSSTTADCSSPYTPYDFELVASYGPESGTVNYVDSGLRQRTDYCYEIRLTRSDGTIYTSPLVCTTTLPATPIVEMTLVPTASQVTVEWKDDIITDNQVLLYEVRPDTTTTLLTTWSTSPNSTCQAYSYVETGLNSEEKHCYRLVAVTPLETVKLEDQCVTTLYGPPAAPYVGISKVTQNSMTISYYDESQDESDNMLQRCDTNCENCQTVKDWGAIAGAGTVETFVDTGLQPNTNYCYLGFASNSAGRNFGFDVATTQSAPQTTFNNSVFLTAQSVYSGPQPFTGTFGSANSGHLETVSTPFNQAATLYFPKFAAGYGTADCANPNAVVAVNENGTMSPSDMSAIWGSSEPAFPVAFVACVGAANGAQLSQVAVNITWTSN